MAIFHPRFSGALLASTFMVVASASYPIAASAQNKAPTQSGRDYTKSLVDQLTALRRDRPEIIEQNTQTVRDVMARASNDRRRLAVQDNTNYAMNGMMDRARGGLNVNVFGRFAGENGNPFMNQGDNSPGQLHDYGKNLSNMPRPCSPQVGITPLFGCSTSSSYPSGHTSKATGASLLAAFILPERFQAFINRGQEYGESRIVAGQHYPLDVMAARAMTYKAVADLLAQQVGDPNSFLTWARTNARRDQIAFCGARTIQQCADSRTDGFSDHDTNKAYHEYTRNYGFGTVGRTDIAMEVPENAEYLILTRFPYLDTDQLREVIRTTADPSGGVLDDPWSRINLFAAADGYGAFARNVTVTMDAARASDQMQSGADYFAADTWRNSIDGPGILTKAGSGVLTLTGANSFGGLVVRDGGVVLTGVSTLGGNVSVERGELRVSGRLLRAGGDLTSGENGRISLSDALVGAGGSIDLRGATAVSGAVTIDTAASGGIISGTLSGDAALTKSGAGALALNGDGSGLRGSLRVSQGRVDVNGTVAGAVSVDSGAALAGAGSVGVLSIADGGRLAGRSGRTLSMASLDLASGAQVDVLLGVPTSALFRVAGDVTLAGMLNVADAGGMGAGVYRLFDYGGRLTDKGLALGAIPAGTRDNYAIQTGVAGQVNLVSSVGATLNFWDGEATGSADNGRIDGGAGSWSAGGRGWTTADGAVNGPMQPAPGFAVFQGSGGAVTVSNGSGAVMATGMQFASGGYRITGDTLALAGAGGRNVIRVGDGSADGQWTTATIDAAVSGTGDLVKTDRGTLVLRGANSYIGNTLVEGGTLVGSARSIRGNVSTAGTVVFDEGADATFAGTVAGLSGIVGTAVKRGTGNLTLGGASSADWSIEAGGLTTAGGSFTGNAAIGNGGLLTFVQSGEGTYGGNLRGGGTLRVSRGTLRLTGDNAAFTGAVRLEGANLMVVGRLGATLAVGERSVLGGAGTVGSAIIARGGTIAPGTSVGTLTIAGDLTFQPGSRFEVEVDPLGTASDRIDVMGQARLAGTVAHVGPASGYRPRATYTILTAGAGLVGSFDGVTSSYAFLSPRLGYTTNAVTLTLLRNDIRFDRIGITANQRGVGRATETLGFDNPVYDAVVELGATEARAAFTNLSGELHPSIAAMLVEDSRFVRNAALERVRSADDAPGTAIWGQSIGAWGHLGATAGTARLERQAYGGVAGIEGVSADGDVRLGVTGSYQHDNLSGKGQADADSWQGGIYGGATFGRVTLGGGAVLGWHRIDATRQVAYGARNEQLRTRRGGGSAQVFADIAYDLPMAGGGIAPFANIAHVMVDLGRAVEKGGDAALTLRAQDTDVTLTTLGLRGSGTLPLAGGGVTLRSSLGWRHGFGELATSQDATLQGAGFTAVGARRARDAISTELGVGTDLGSGIRIEASYAGELARRNQDHSARASLRASF